MQAEIFVLPALCQILEFVPLDYLADAFLPPRHRQLGGWIRYHLLSLMKMNTTVYKHGAALLVSVKQLPSITPMSGAISSYSLSPPPPPSSPRC